MNSTYLQKHLAGVLIPVFAMRRANDLGIGDTQAVMEAKWVVESGREDFMLPEGEFMK